jgi:mRNA-degrading endonuclease toxin of MazEF toxin-antitoxin module
VVVVNVPFSDHSGVKPRPALVVSAESFHRGLPDVIVCPISSQPRYYRRPGTVRISKVLAVDKQITKRILGRLSQPDLARVETGLRQALGLL